MKKGDNHTALSRRKISRAMKRSHAERKAKKGNKAYASRWTDDAKAKQSRRMKRYWKAVWKGEVPFPKMYRKAKSA